MDERRFRLDFVIAFFALVISTVAALASVYQTRVISQQLSATVWPYLNFDNTFGPQSVTLSLTNYGLGPALVRSADMTLNGKHVGSWDDVIGAYLQLARRMHVKGRTQISDANLDASVVLSAGVSRRLLDVRTSATTIRAVRAIAREISLRVCYCSLLGQCWEIVSRQKGAPAPRSSCPIGAEIAAETPAP
ncbi:MAG TPA: hypothetical protein VFF63_02265 [Candidatus Babeliales bacterium]|nr:hypothetical protein [Candidatus Babeliales bacterium]